MAALHFSCAACGLDEARVEVRERCPGESYAEWLEQATEAAGVAHFLRSPACEAETVILKLG